MISLVTGANGLIGSQLVEELVGLGHQVRCVVLESDPLGIIKDLPVEIIYADVCQPNTLDRAVAGVDYVFHLAGIKMADDTQTYYHVNTDGTKNVVDAIIRHNPKLKRLSVNALCGCSISSIQT